jgi:hypothetical protein
MKTGLIPAFFAFCLGGVAAAAPGEASEAKLTPMPAELETSYALSAAPPQLRDKATVYLLDPAKGYQLAKQGTSGVTCIVQRTAWELVDFRDDIYIPLCYDTAGTKTYLKYIMDVADLRVQGLDPQELKAEIEKRYADGTYKVPEKAGVSYMVAPVMRTVGPPDMKVHTMPMPHVMFYAPHITNEDLGAVPDLNDPASLLNPFIDRQGNAEQSYMIQMVGAAEKARILADEKALVDALCAHRDILCLDHSQH